MPCFEGVDCMDIPAPGVGAECGPCPEGYMEDQEKCIGTKLHDGIINHLLLICISKGILTCKVNLSKL